MDRAVAGYAYQADGLLEKLLQFRSADYSKEARVTAAFLAAFVFRVRDALWSNAYTKNELRWDDNKARELGRTIQLVHSLVRYIAASDPRVSPPSLQRILSDLGAQLVAPLSNSPVVVLVRPQWKYNSKFLSLSTLVRSLVNFEVLDEERDPEDPIAEAGIYLDEAWEEFINASWKLDSKPGEIGVLSFPGLDHGSLLEAPILVHELAHFYDYSTTPPLHHKFTNKAFYTFESFAAQLKSFPLSESELVAHWRETTRMIGVAIRELLADAIATRIMGFSFFLAEAEVLPRVSEEKPPEPPILDTGYPGMAVRLDAIRRTLDEMHGGSFSKACRRREHGLSPEILKWVEHSWKGWDDLIQNGLVLKRSRSKRPEAQLRERLRAIRYSAVRNAIPEILDAAGTIVPPSLTAKMTPGLSRRLQMLNADLPPHLDGDTSSDFAEILTAAWIFYLIECANDKRPSRELHEARARYLKINRLVEKALELTSADLRNSGNA